MIILSLFNHLTTSVSGFFLAPDVEGQSEWNVIFILNFVSFYFDGQCLPDIKLLNRSHVIGLNIWKVWIKKCNQFFETYMQYRLSGCIILRILRFASYRLYSVWLLNSRCILSERYNSKMPLTKLCVCALCLLYSESKICTELLRFTWTLCNLSNESRFRFWIKNLQFVFRKI